MCWGVITYSFMQEARCSSVVVFAHGVIGR